MKVYEVLLCRHKVNRPATSYCIAALDNRTTKLQLHLQLQHVQVEDFVRGRDGGAGRLQPRDWGQDGQGHGELAQVSPRGVCGRRDGQDGLSATIICYKKSSPFFSTICPSTASRADSAPCGGLVSTHEVDVVWGMRHGFVVCVCAFLARVIASVFLDY